MPKSKGTRVNGQLEAAIQALLRERPIAYHASLAKAFGSATAGILLSQLLYWMPRSTDEDGWVWKTREDIYEETALSRYEQESARKVLRDAGVLQEQRMGMPARMHFRVNMKRLTEMLASYWEEGNGIRELSDDSDDSQLGENQPTSWGGSRQPVGGIPTNLKGENQPTAPYITETTTETTSETTTTKGGVVAELKDLGISKSAAYRMTDRHPLEYISEKIEQVRWLQENEPHKVDKNPAGFLRRAIEEDWPPPLGYKGRAERQVEEEERKRRESCAICQGAGWYKVDRPGHFDGVMLRCNHAERKDALARQAVESG
jgi:hypothetical protein